jgi:hypothetical protein
MPGAVVDLSASVLPIASGGATPMLSGVVFGPVGLDEPDTRNNLAVISADSLFGSGFDMN